MGYEDLVESRIQEAMAAGAFDRLEGMGRPLRVGEQGGEDWLGYKILQNGGMLPEWLSLAREIERDTASLAELDRRHAEWVGLAAAGGAWQRHGSALLRLRATYAQRARELRRKQDRFNFDAPSIALERPGIWVEHHLERLDNRLREAGAPEALYAPLPSP